MREQKICPDANRRNHYHQSIVMKNNIPNHAPDTDDRHIKAEGIKLETVVHRQLTAVT